MNICLCCLQSNTPLLSINKCNYSTSINNTINKYLIKLSNLVLCIPCHAVLRKTFLFQKQVEENCRVLSDCLEECNDEITHTVKFKLKFCNLETTNYIPQTEDDIKQEIEIADEETDEIDFEAEDIKCEDIFLLEPKKRKGQRKVKKEPLVISEDFNLNFVESNLRRIDLNEKEVVLERLREKTKSSYISMKYKCETCLVGFNFEEGWQNHMEKKHNKDIGDFFCDICSTVFNKQASFITHYKRHYVRFECLICGHRGIDKTTMERHIQHHDKAVVQLKFTCEACGFVANTKRSFRYHKEKHNSQNKCKYCMKTYSNKNALKCHTLLVHKKERVFSCEECAKTYKTNSGLLMHKFTHKKSPAEAYCQLCNYQFKNIYIYHQHLKNSLKHTTEDDKKFICECGLKFHKKRRLQDHINWVHLKRNQHACDICDKKFMRVQGLMKHKKFVHEKFRGPRDKICDHCGRGFTTNRMLLQHIRTHTGERPIKCTQCEATFAQSAALYTHTKLVHKQKAAAGLTHQTSQQYIHT